MFDIVKSLRMKITVSMQKEEAEEKPSGRKRAAQKDPKSPPESKSSKKVSC